VLGKEEVKLEAGGKSWKREKPWEVANLRDDEKRPALQAFLFHCR
jgi:hypothetical protein